MNVPLTPLTLDQVTAKFDTEAPPVRWLIQQIQTYDQVTSNIIGLSFDTKTVLAHVIQCGTVRTAADEED